MADAIENLKKLPPECAAMIAGRKVWITRGAREPLPLSTPLGVEERNRQLGVTDAQVKAMIVGVTLGWDQPGADPDTHARVMQQPTGPYQYEFVGEVCLQLRVEACTLEQAQRVAREILQTAADLSTEDDSRVVSAGPSDTLDLSDTTDPNA